MLDNFSRRHRHHFPDRAAIESQESMAELAVLDNFARLDTARLEANHGRIAKNARNMSVGHTTVQISSVAARFIHRTCRRIENESKPFRHGVVTELTDTGYDADTESKGLSKKRALNTSVNGWNMFVQDKTAGRKGWGSEVFEKGLGQQWADLPDGEKQQYNDLADEVNAARAVLGPRDVDVVKLMRPQRVAPAAGHPSDSVALVSYGDPLLTVQKVLKKWKRKMALEVAHWKVQRRREDGVLARWEANQDCASIKAATGELQPSGFNSWETPERSMRLSVWSPAIVDWVEKMLLEVGKRSGASNRTSTRLSNTSDSAHERLRISWARRCCARM